MANTITAGNATNGGTALASDSSGALSIVTGTGAGTTAVTIDTSQNVGIGTTPSYKLQVSGTAVGSAVWANVNNTDTTNGATAGFFGSNGSVNAVMYSSSFAGYGVFGMTTNHPAVFFTNNTERARIDTNGYMYSQPNSAGQGLVPGMMTYILNADNNLNGTLLTLQNPFGVATPTLQPGRYRYRLAMGFVKNTGTGQATYAMGGTATISYAAHNIYTRAGATFQTTASPVFQFITTTTPTVSVAITGNTTAVAQDTIVSDGYIDVSVAGTVFFGVGFSSAPGTSTAGSYRFVQGSYVEIWPVSATGANTNIGGWA